MFHIFFLSLLIFFSGLTNVYSQDVPLKVEISFAEHPVENADGKQENPLTININALIVNVSDAPQEFEIWSCGNMDWQTDNPMIVRGTSVCRQNHRVKITLKPKESRQKNVRLDISEALPAGLHKFRLGFFFKETTIWSEPVAIFCVVRNSSVKAE